jgi:arylsulfatase A-like enzyme
MKFFVAMFNAASLLFGCSFAVATPVNTSRPNIVIILADDMGWGDPQCYQSESKIPTPNLDRLAAEGMRFTDAHTPSSVCTPTRYTLLTGRYCWRTSLQKGVLDGFGPPLIGAEDVTLATMLKNLGYRTACVGKWHIGMNWFDRGGNPMGERGPQRFRSGDDVDFERDITGGPCDVGFDSYFGISASLDMSPYAYIRNRRVETLPTQWHDEIEGTIFLNGVSGVKSPGFDVHEVLSRLGDEAVSVIQKTSEDDRLLFLYMPLNSPHLPIAPSPEAKGKSAAGDYGDFVWETDQTVGRVLNALDDAGMTEDTLVLFTSDNGGLWHWWDFHADDDGGKIPLTPRGEYVKQFGHQSNAMLRGTKADIHEGGHRVPFLVRWPAKIAARKVSDALVELTDVFATVAEISGHPTRQGNSGMDSFSFLSVLTGEAKTARPFSIHHSLAGMFALRQGNWKMIEGRGSGGFTSPKAFKIKPGEPAGQLYDLASDAREQHNQWSKASDRVTSMTAILDSVRDNSARNAAESQGR